MPNKHYNETLLYAASIFICFFRSFALIFVEPFSFTLNISFFIKNRKAKKANSTHVSLVYLCFDALQFSHNNACRYLSLSLILSFSVFMCARLTNSSLIHTLQRDSSTMVAHSTLSLSFFRHTYVSLPDQAEKKANLERKDEKINETSTFLSAIKSVRNKTNGRTNKWTDWLTAENERAWNRKTTLEKTARTTFTFRAFCEPKD